MNVHDSILAAGACLLFVGCSANALYFAESTKFGFATEIKPDASEPVSSTLGYKRHIAAVVPPKHQPQGENDPMLGEALSLVSKFDVQPAEDGSRNGINISHNFASGRAAKALVGVPLVSPDGAASTSRASSAEVGNRVEALMKPVLLPGEDNETP